MYSPDTYQSIWWYCAFLFLVSCLNSGGADPQNESTGDTLEAAEKPDISSVSDADDDKQGDSDRLRYGFLQLRVDHNLDSADCISNGACRIESNERDSIKDWLSRLREDSNLAVLHWNRPIPYDIFSESPAAGTEVVDFYDAKLPAELRNWIRAFVHHFDNKEFGFVQVSALDGPRRRPAKLYQSDGNHRHITATQCPKLGPDTTFDIRTSNGEVDSFHFQTAYVNFLMYLYQKLEPEYFALVVEANLFKKHCPNQWTGFAKLYRNIYDSVRSAVDPEPKLFATFTYSDILNYDLDRCTGGLKAVGCHSEPSGQPYGKLEAETCFPIDASPIEDLNRGGRVDLLGLSLYPDGFLMRTPDGPKSFSLHPADAASPDDCTSRFMMPEALNPWDQLDRLNWDKSVAITETSTRSCSVWQWSSRQNREDALLRLPATPSTQRYWLREAVEAARRHDMPFFVQSL